MVTAREIEEILLLGHETRSFETKGPGSLREKAYVAKVARAAMAMGNLRDGGLVCLGIDDAQLATMTPGLGTTQTVEWADFDNVSDALARYSDPPVSFELWSFTLSSGARVVVLEVAEFDRDPHVCRRDFPGVLQDGHTYVRPRRKPESVPIPTAAEGRELHDLAVDKGVREFVRRAAAAGLLPGGSVPAPGPEDLERAMFSREAETAWAVSTPVSDALAGGAFIDVAVCPGPHQPARLHPGQLEEFVVEHQVRMRGWPVPYVDGAQPLMRHGAWVGQDIAPEVVPHDEAWRLFTSGQFLQRRALATDLRHAAELTASAPGATGAVAVWDVLLYLVEVAELGARYVTALKSDVVTYNVALEGVAGRELISGDARRELHGPYLIAVSRPEHTVSAPTARVLADPRALGVELAQGLLRQFGLDVSDQVLLDWQAQVFDHG